MRYQDRFPAELSQLQNLTELRLNGNWLTGQIPVELSQLQNLEELVLSGNRLTGQVPRELAQLQNLRNLNLAYNGALTGQIPKELALLQNLTSLSLADNQLTGQIPPELGRLAKLGWLTLGYNQLTGPIPAELGQLRNLEVLTLESNELTGQIPAELGQLRRLRHLWLFQNQLMGQIPEEFGQLRSLWQLWLSSNRLSGDIPNTFGDLANLKSLHLTKNVDMSGMLPWELINLNLEELLLGGTRLCAPSNRAFQQWLRRIPNSYVANCVPLGRSTAYLTQATQSLTHPVPLVAGEDALLRVFITTQSDEEIAMPAVKVTFFRRGTEVRSMDIPGPGASVPRQIDEGDLSASVNAIVPGSIIMPGLEMVVEIDPEGVLEPALGIGGRLPSMGRKSVDVRDVPSFLLTLVPFLWTEDSDRSILTKVEDLTADSDLFRLTRDILPVHDFSLDVREPVWTSFDPVGENMQSILQETQLVRTMDGAIGHYMGILRDGGGIADTPGYVSASFLGGGVIAHELGHNFSLFHAPCGTLGDPNFPYTDGTIGAWGYDFLEGRLVSPDTFDLMSYCGPKWISDYYFSKALNYRVSQAASMTATYAAPARSLLLWGGVNEDSEIVLEPAFVVDVPASLPRLDGPYRVVGEAQGGSTLFDLRFGMAEIDHSEGGSFAFVIPARPDWPGRLTRITLSGPEGVATLGDGDDRSAALLLDPVDGRVRGILRDWPEPDATLQSARRVLPETGLEIVISRGLPASADW